MEWENNFSKRILNRGFNYYLDGYVEDISITKNKIKAVVYGTHHYCVEIDLDGDEIKDMSCNCPYAQDGFNCKHMAAVLFEWERRVTHPEIDNSKIIDDASDDDIRSFLLQLFNENPELVERFKQSSSTDNSMDAMTNELLEIICHYQYDHNYINTDHTVPFVRTMKNVYLSGLIFWKRKKNILMRFIFS